MTNYRKKEADSKRTASFLSNFVLQKLDCHFRNDLSLTGSLFHRNIDFKAISAF